MKYLLILLLAGCATTEKYEGNIMNCKMVNYELSIYRCEIDYITCYTRLYGISCDF